MDSKATVTTEHLEQLVQASTATDPRTAFDELAPAGWTFHGFSRLFHRVRCNMPVNPEPEPAAVIPPVVVDPPTNQEPPKDHSTAAITTALTPKTRTEELITDLQNGLAAHDRLEQKLDLATEQVEQSFTANESSGEYEFGMTSDELAGKDMRIEVKEGDGPWKPIDAPKE